MRHAAIAVLVTVLITGAFPDPGAAQIAYAGTDGTDDYLDSLEARVWLDRGPDAVVQPGEEVRAYYRTSEDAYAAIFRIDTDGRIHLVYPQHPRVDPYVVGGRDYRLLFPGDHGLLIPGSARWRVREDPGVGYFFMVASRTPLDFSLFGWDDRRGWDLAEVGETVYEDPYVAIDDYVAAVLPSWETTPYALDFLEYDVGEDHDYPRFLCYDCHGFRSYARWDPYGRACSSYQVVIWDDPYFYPRFRYVGTRVVFGRPLGPRPRYGMTARIVGSSRGPVIRTRAAPPPRIADYKEGPGRRPYMVRPGRPSSRLGAPRVRSPDRGVPRILRPSAPERSPTTRPSASARNRPPVRSPGASGRGRAGASSQRERPTLQRRVPSARSRPAARSPRGGGSRVTPSRSSGARGPAARSAPRPTGPRATPPPSGRAGRPAPARRPGGGVRRPVGGRSPAASSVRPGSRPRAGPRVGPRRPGASSSPPARGPGGAASRPPSGGSRRPSAAPPRRPGSEPSGSGASGSAGRAARVTPAQVPAPEPGAGGTPSR